VYVGHAAHRRLAVARVGVDRKLVALHELLDENDAGAGCLARAAKRRLELGHLLDLGHAALPPPARRFEDDGQALGADERFDLGERARADEGWDRRAARTVRLAHQVLGLATIDRGHVAVEGHA
jgi:hypothetical protein